jgi:hypothetical protein
MLLSSGNPLDMDIRLTDVELSSSQLERYGIASIGASVDEIMKRFFLETGTKPGEIADEMRLIHSIGRPGSRERPPFPYLINPVAEFYIKALEREGTP